MRREWTTDGALAPLPRRHPAARLELKPSGMLREGAAEHGGDGCDILLRRVLGDDAQVRDHGVDLRVAGLL
jgi:hypothetical protein